MSTVLAIDDNPSTIYFYEELFGQKDFTILTADCAQQALEVLSENGEQIDAILSDIMMPNMDGYEFCQKVKSQSQLEMIPFIFVSALTDLDEKIKGYEVGADDYITKPIQAEEMIAKVNNVIAVREINHALNEQLSQSMNTAMQAMTYSSNLGLLLEFVKDGLTATSYHHLANNIFKFLNSINLKAVVQIHTPLETSTFSHKGVAAPIEENIFELSRNGGRFIDFGARTIINYETYSLLIKNMPKDDPDKYGMIKDLLGTFCDIVEVKIDSLLKENEQQQKEETINNISSTLNEVINDFKGVQKENMDALGAMMDDMEFSMSNMDLMEYQEESLKEAMETCMARTNQSFEMGLKVNEKFDFIRTEIMNLLK